MEDITKTQNLNSHYTTSTKVAKPERIVVKGPDYIPEHQLYTDRKANERLSAIEADVYESIQKTPRKRNKNKFLGIF